MRTASHIRRLAIAASFMLPCPGGIDAQDGPKDRSWLSLALAQYQQVWSGRGTLVYSQRSPGRQLYVRDLRSESRYDPTADYHPEMGPDTVRFAFDKKGLNPDSSTLKREYMTRS